MPELRIEKAVITGGREFSDIKRIEADLRALVGVGLRRVAHGGARGADTRAEMAWRRAKPWPRETEVYAVNPAAWKRFGDAAGPMRNGRMLEVEKPDIVLAYPNPPQATTESRGTWDCVEQALAGGIVVVLWQAPTDSPLPLKVVNRACAVVKRNMWRRILVPSATKTAWAEQLAEVLDA